MGTQIDITLVVVNPTLDDTIALARIQALDLITGVGLDPVSGQAGGIAMDSVGADISCAVTAPGEITRVVRFTFGALFVSAYGATNALQGGPFVDVLKKILQAEFPGAQITETRVVS